MHRLLGPAALDQAAQPCVLRLVAEQIHAQGRPPPGQHVAPELSILVALKRQLASEELVQQEAQSIDVHRGPPPLRGVCKHLGRSIAAREGVTAGLHRSGGGDTGTGLERGGGSVSAEASQPEIGNHSIVVPRAARELIDQDVPVVTGRGLDGEALKSGAGAS